MFGKGLFAIFSRCIKIIQSLRAPQRRGNPGATLKILPFAPGLLRFDRNDAKIAALCLCMILIPSTMASVPEPWQFGFQPAASPIMEGITHMHNLVLVVITAIALLVGALLSYVMVRFRASRNPTPSKTSHHTLLEVVWTMIPVLILVVIAVPSLKLLFSLDKAQNATMTVKAIGHQWYWSYEYPEKHITYDSYMIKEKDLKPGQIRLLSVDNPIIVPVDTTVRILVTSQDVVHSFAVPSLGIKKDAVPGRLNETWLRIGKIGDYYGQCSELCGVEHGFMPIHVKVVSHDEYEAWEKSKAKPEIKKAPLTQAHAQEPPKELAKEPAKELAKEPAKEPVKEPTKDSHKDKM